MPIWKTIRHVCGIYGVDFQFHRLGQSYSLVTISNVNKARIHGDEVDYPASRLAVKVSSHTPHLHNKQGNSQRSLPQSSLKATFLVFICISLKKLMSQIFNKKLISQLFLIFFRYLQFYKFCDIIFCNVTNQSFCLDLM